MKTYYIEKYLSEVSHLINFNSNLILQSPPGSGKSKFFLQTFKGKRIFLCPTVALLNDLHSYCPTAQMVQEGVNSFDIREGETILSTYEGLEKILNSSLNFSSFTLIIDEAHNLFFSSSPEFRFLSMYRISQNFMRFKSTFLISGTFVFFPFTDVPFETVEIKYNTPPVHILEVVSTDTPLDSLSTEVVYSEGKMMILVNNKAENFKLKRLIQGHNPNVPVTIFNSDTKNSLEVLKIMKDNHLQPNEKFVCTQSGVEGISLLDDDLKSILIFRSMSTEHMVQLVNRSRSQASKPPLKLYLASKKFRLSKTTDYMEIYDKLERKYRYKKRTMRSEFVEGSAMKYYIERVEQSDKISYHPTPYICDPTHSDDFVINPLLLGNQVLEEVLKRFNGDLFSQLAHLRENNFEFRFSEVSPTSIRETFKSETQASNRELIRDNFENLPAINEENYQYDQHNPILLAGLICRLVDKRYFLSMTADEREQLFFNPIKVQRMAEQAWGFILLRGNNTLHAKKLVGETFSDYNEVILCSIRKVRGYPDRIFNDELSAKYKALGLSVVKLKNVLRRHFELLPGETPTKDKDGKSKRWFSLVPRTYPFHEFINSNVIYGPGKTIS